MQTVQQYTWEALKKINGDNGSHSIDDTYILFKTKFNWWHLQPLKKKLDAWYDGNIKPSHLPPALHMHANNHDLSHANNHTPSFIDGSEQMSSCEFIEWREEMSSLSHNHGPRFMDSSE